ncbi:hypothetical protein BKA67DRAFT_417357 [Truncatella angustata]|uniref:Uncharacterized protein n=1 Tax=Truncatella angustata TaxID=152316 RepID=A0A9P8RM89_9PEZI|nr:uncharacterized protein BKA67DRAFT_417357 [Truncatella angustata]KAH6646828.1 hypothetical protein BKA67DRAFT_417357 [Truncatella angustata]
MFRFAVVISLLAAPALCLSGFPSVCLSEPPVKLQAGISEVSIIIERDVSVQCQASIYFEDLSLPLRFSFPSVQCAGAELVSFLVPLGITSGNATIIWQCAGQVPTCSQAMISDGVADQSMKLDWAGQVACVREILETSTSLLTEIESSSTIVQTLRSLIVVTTTSSFMAPTNTPREIGAPWISSNASHARCSGIPIQTTSAYIPETTGAKSLRLIANDSITIAPSGSAVSSGTPQDSTIPSLLPVTAGTRKNIPGMAYGVVVFFISLHAFATLLHDPE